MDPELQAWARRAFRPARLHGRLPARTAVARALSLQGPKTEIMGLRFRPGRVALYAGIVGVSFLIGRWWARRRTHETMIGLELLGAE